MLRLSDHLRILTALILVLVPCKCGRRESCRLASLNDTIPLRRNMHNEGKRSRHLKGSCGLRRTRVIAPQRRRAHEVAREVAAYLDGGVLPALRASTHSMGMALYIFFQK